MKLETAGTLTLVLTLVAVIIRNVEFLTVHREFATGGIFASDLFLGSGLLSRLARRLGYRPIVWLLALEAVLASMMLVQTRHPSSHQALAVAVLCATHVTIGYRARHSLDGSDQMLTVLLTSAFVYCSTADTSIRKIALIFVAGQSLLAYLASGMSKLWSPLWRRGEAVGRIVSTTSYGVGSISRTLQQRPTVARIATWGTIALEVSFPAVLFSPLTLAVILTSGLIFHLVIALTMGLNRFVFAFVATYPSLVFVSQNLDFVHRVVSG